MWILLLLIFIFLYLLSEPLLFLVEFWRLCKKFSPFHPYLTFIGTFNEVGDKRVSWIPAALCVALVSAFWASIKKQLNLAKPAATSKVLATSFLELAIKLRKKLATGEK